MHNHIKKLLFFYFVTLLLLNESSCFAAEPQPVEDPQAQLKALLEESEKKIIALNQELGVKESNIAQFKEQFKEAEETAKAALTAEQNKLNKNYTDAQTQYQTDMQKLQAEFAQKEDELKKNLVNITQTCQYGFQGTLPESAAKEQGGLFKAQADQVRYEIGWKKMGTDVAGATLKKIVCPLIVSGLAPKSEEFFKNTLGKTRLQEINDAIAEDNKEMSALNKELLQQQKQKYAQTSRHEEEILKIQRRSALFTQYGTACHGINTDNCEEMGKMIDAMLKADLAKCYKESTGKEYIAPTED